MLRLTSDKSTGVATGAYADLVANNKIYILAPTDAAFEPVLAELDAFHVGRGGNRQAGQRAEGPHRRGPQECETKGLFLSFPLFELSSSSAAALFLRFPLCI
jgi:hypothetical protein